MKFQKCFEDVPRMFPNDCFVQNARDDSDIALDKDNPVQHASKDLSNQLSKVRVSNIILRTLFIKNCCKIDEVSRMF